LSASVGDCGKALAKQIGNSIEQAKGKDGMRTNTRRFAWLCTWALLLASGFTLAADEPANVTGTWKITVTGESGSAEQTVVLNQDGNKITGTFRGPRQSGSLEGLVDGNKITFHVNARISLDYRGMVDGDRMKGTMTAKGKSGEWTATRGK
jgi:hypothetical protein